jgi:hypothetical protein
VEVENEDISFNFSHHGAAEVPLQKFSAPTSKSVSSEEEWWIPLVDGPELAMATSTSIPPNSIKEALSRPDAEKWMEAAQEEIKAHLENGTWEVVPLPKGRTAIGCRWVFKIKHNLDGSVERYKGRLVAKGFQQREGIDFVETFAPTARFPATRIVLSEVVNEGWELHTVDVLTAFLQGDIDTEVYMKLPEGVTLDDVEEGSSEWALRLLKGLYGLKQGSRLWWLTLHKVLKQLGFERMQCDNSVYIYRKEGLKLVIPVHTDDLLIAGKSLAHIESFLQELSAHLKVRHLGPAKSFLGIAIDYDKMKRTLSLSQSHYLQTIFDEFVTPILGWQPDEMNACDVPVITKGLSIKDCPKTDEEKETMKRFPYREIIGKLMYLMLGTRPDIAYALGLLCRFSSNPGLKHWGALKHLLRYLIGTKDYGLVFTPNASPHRFTTFCDSDFSMDKDTSRSTGGFAVMVGNTAVAWASKLQPRVTKSSVEAEYTNASRTGSEVVWTRYFYEEIDKPINGPSILYMDSASARQVCTNPEKQSTMKHVHRAYHWIRENVEDRIITVQHVSGAHNPADIFTKPLGKIKFIEFRNRLGVAHVASESEE